MNKSSLSTLSILKNDSNELLIFYLWEVYSLIKQIFRQQSDWLSHFIFNIGRHFPSPGAIDVHVFPLENVTSSIPFLAGILQVAWQEFARKKRQTE